MRPRPPAWAKPNLPGSRMVAMTVRCWASMTVIADLMSPRFELRLGLKGCGLALTAMTNWVWGSQTMAGGFGPVGRLATTLSDWRSNTLTWLAGPSLT